MSPLKPSCPPTASPEYSKTADVQAKDLKTKYRKTMEFVKEEINKSLKEIQEDTNSMRK